MSSRGLIHQLMSQVLAEVRHNAKTLDRTFVFRLANVFQSIPVALDLAGQGQMLYDDIVPSLKLRAERNGLTRWFVDVMDQMTANHGMDTSRGLAYRLLYNALIDIRAEACAMSNTHMFCLADIIHNVPLQLELAAQGKTRYDDILAWIRDRAIQRGCQRWLDQAILASTDGRSTGEENM